MDLHCPIPRCRITETSDGCGIRGSAQSTASVSDAEQDDVAASPTTFTYALGKQIPSGQTRWAERV